MSSLQDLYIADSYDSLLHANGEPIGATGKSKIYDGSGQETALSLGLDGNGATVSGSLSTSDLKVGGLTMPKIAGSQGSIPVQNANNELEMSSDISSSILSDLNPSPSGTYNDIGEIVVNSKGLVTQINPTSDDNDSGEISITKTTYRSSANNAYSQVVIGEDWVKVILPDNNKWKNSKSGIFFLKPRPTQSNIQGLTPESRKFIYIVASPDKSLTYPALYIMGGEDASGGVDWWGVGSQFSCPIGFDSSGNAVIYFSLDDTNVSSSSILDNTWELYLIARQK